MKLFSKLNISVGLFLFSFIVYLLTHAQDLMFTDSGELAAVCATLGVAHPTGYPLFTILGYVWTLLPLPVTTIYQLNMFAAFVTALSVPIFFQIMILVFEVFKNTEVKAVKTKKKVRNSTKYDLNSEYLIAASGALIYAFALTIWQQATMLEVYSLQALMYTLIIWSLLKAWLSEKLQTKYYVLTALLIGLGFSNHMTTILVLPAVFFLFFYKFNSGFDISKDRVKLLFVLILPMLLGLSFYLYLPLRSAGLPEFNWGEVSRSFDKFWYHATGRQYQEWMFSGTEAFNLNVDKFFSVLLPQLGWIGVLPMLFGLIASYKLNKAIFWFCLILIVSTLFYSLNYSIHDIETYFTLAFISMIIIATIGIYSIFKNKPKLVGLAFLIPLVSLVSNYSENDESMNFLVPEYTRIMADNLEKDAIVISAQWDFWCSAFWYKQRVEGYRKDVVLVEKELLRRTWYLNQFDRWYPEVAGKSKIEMNQYHSQLELFESDNVYDPYLIQKYFIDFVNSIIENNIDKRPIYITMDILQNPIDTAIGSGYQKIPYGFAFKLEKNPGIYDAELDKINVDMFLKGVKKTDNHLVKGILETASMNVTNIGRYAQYQGQIDKARAAYSLALRIYPENQAAIGSMQQIGQ